MTLTAREARGASLPTSTTDPADHGREWTTTCVYAHLTPAGHDRFIHDCVVPLAQALTDAGDADGWFFLRYWHGGPHVRVRFRNPVPEALDRFETMLRAYLAEHREDRTALDPEIFRSQFGVSDPHDWQQHGDVLREPYIPETDRYGGPEMLAHCEEFFETSSRIAGSALAVDDRDKVFALGLDLMVLALREALPDPLDSARSARRYFLSWDFVSETAPARALALQHAEALQAGFGRAWARREAAVGESVRTDPRSTHGVWRQAVHDLLDRLREAEEAGRLTRPPEAVLWSLLHMMNNRLGISVHEERVLSWLASRICSGWWVGQDYFADDATSADRAYLEQSKYAEPGTGADQRPRPEALVAASRSRRGGAPPATRSLPAPAPLSMSLTDVLAARESSYGDYGGSLSLADLATILGHAAGPQPHRTIDTPIGPVARRSYPSPGAVYATSVMVNAWDVEGLDAGLYLYQAHEHTLVRLGPAVGRETLLRSAPNFTGEDEVDPTFSISIDTVPTVLFLVGDLAAIRPKYGLRALRLLLQEAGHLAQNIALCAAAADARSIPLSAFTDDDLSTAVHLDAVDGFVSTVIPLGAAGASEPAPRPPTDPGAPASAAAPAATITERNAP